MHTLKKFARLYSNKFVSKWLVFGIDLLITTIAFSFTYVLRYNFDFSAVDWGDFQLRLPYVVLIYLIGFLAFKSYVGIIRHTSINDAIRVFNSTTVSLFFLICVSILWKIIDIKSYFYVPFSILIIHNLLTVLALLSSRVLFKLTYFRILERTKEKKNVMIFGAGSSGLITRNTLLKDSILNYKVIGFIDDNPSLVGKTIEGSKVYEPSTVFTQDFIEKKKITEVIISVQMIQPSRKRLIIDNALKYGLRVKSVPPVTDWIGGQLSAKQIRKVKIEDLLGRDSIQLDKEHIRKDLENKTVLISGAAGSIGSEIVRQVYHYKPKKILLLDQSETGLFDIENEIKVMSNHSADIEPIIADVSNAKRMQSVFENWGIDTVYHAAAYKHVPMMERNASEAIQCNVLGTKILADLAGKNNVEKFVMISTDKAVNPTNVMGSSKRIAEIYVQSLNESIESKGGSTKYIITRFGNVLGSNGSVIPTFKKQIDKGGPVIVTHPEITRYFMTIPEACQLVLEAGCMGKGGEIFIFDMGQSVKIVDLAKKMIQLSGLVLGKDIEIKYSGLRDGEKLYEELLNDKEKTISTHHEKIMIAKERQIGLTLIAPEIETLIQLSYGKDDMQMVAQMKHIVPEFVSNHSKYQELDNETSMMAG